MAKVGEGDQRWLVDQKEDGKNVGNWHWSETNCLKFAKEGLEDIVTELVVATDSGLTVSVTGLKSCEGDCYTYNRKGNMYLFYDMNVKLDWKGMASVDEDKPVEGTIELPNISEDIEDEAMELSVSTKSKAATVDEMKAVLRTQGREMLQALILSFMDGLKQRIASKQPAKSSSKPKVNLPSTVPAPNPKTQAASSASRPPNTKEITLKFSFEAPPAQLYDALTNPMRVMGFTGAPAKVDAVPGGKYEYFAGAVQGEYVELTENEKIVKKWRMQSWPEGAFSTVTIIMQGSEKTTLTLLQTGIPMQDANGHEIVPQVKEGWNNNFFARMKGAFGWHYDAL